MVFPSFKPRASTDTDRPRFSLSFGSRQAEAEAAPLDKGKGKQKEDTNDTALEEGTEVPQTNVELEAEAEAEAEKTKSKLPRPLLRLKKCCRTRRCLVTSTPGEDRSPIPGSRSKKRRFPLFGARSASLFHEPLVGSQVKATECPDHDHSDDDDDGRKPPGETMHLKAITFLAGKRNCSQALCFRPAIPVGGRLSTSSDWRPLLAQPQLPSRVPTPWPEASAEQPEGRRSFNIKRKAVPRLSLEEEAALGETEADGKPEPERQVLNGTGAETQAVEQALNELKGRNEAEAHPFSETELRTQALNEAQRERQAVHECEFGIEMQPLRASSIDFPRRPRMVRFMETSEVTEAPVPAPVSMLAERARCDALPPTRRLRPISEEVPAIEPAAAGSKREDHRAHRVGLLAGMHERDFNLYHRRNSWPPLQGLAPPPPRPRVEMLPTQLPTSPDADGISSPSGSGSSGGTPALTGLGISLNNGSGTFGVGTGSPLSPASPRSPISPASRNSSLSPADREVSTVQQPPSPMDAAEDELVYCGRAALWAEESERRETREEDAESDWHEVLCV